MRSSILKLKMSLLSHSENFSKNYLNEPELRALVQLIPLGSSVDTEISLRYAKMNEQRTKVFFDELNDGKIVLTQEIIDSNDFLHCYFITYKYALKTKKKEKIEMFANLLKSNFSKDILNDSDEYEEYLEILYELSYREFKMLNLLNQYELRFPILENENVYQRLNRFWGEYVNDLKQLLGIPESEIHFLLIRLSRTGCYDTFTGKFMDDTLGKGQTTPVFRKLLNLLEK